MPRLDCSLLEAGCRVSQPNSLFYTKSPFPGRRARVIHMVGTPLNRRRVPMIRQRLDSPGRRRGLAICGRAIGGYGAILCSVRIANSARNDPMAGTGLPFSYPRDQTIEVAPRVGEKLFSGSTNFVKYWIRCHHRAPAGIRRAYRLAAEERRDPLIDYRHLGGRVRSRYVDNSGSVDSLRPIPPQLLREERQRQLSAASVTVRGFPWQPGERLHLCRPIRNL